MNNIPGINIINQTSEMVTVYGTSYHFKESILYLVIVLILVIGGIFLLEKIPKFVPLVLPIIICLGGFLAAQGIMAGFQKEEKEIITYTVTMDKTTPYIDLLDYELIEIKDNNTYIFKTKINP